MSKLCEPCHHKRLAEINTRILEGATSQAICEEFNISKISIDYHRKSGHAGRELTRQVLNAQAGPLSDWARIAIAAKVVRMKKLQRLVTKIERVMEQRAQVYGHLPGGDTGLVGLRLKSIGAGPNAHDVEESFFDESLAGAYRATLEQAAKEAGDWSPDGGKAADATKKLAQSIVIHAAAQVAMLENLENSDKPSDIIDIQADKPRGQE